MKKLLSLLLLSLLLSPLCASAEEAGSFSLAAPASIRPYRPETLSVFAPEAGEVVLTLADGYSRHEILRRQVEKGSTQLVWNGLVTNGETPARGAYTLSAALQGAQDTYAWEASISVASPVAALQYCIPSQDVLCMGHDGFLVNYLLTNTALLHVHLSAREAPEDILKTWSLQPGDTLPHIFSWNGLLSDRTLTPGDYFLTFSVKGSPQEPIRLPLRLTQEAPPSMPLSVTDPILFLPADGQDEAAVWAALMQPVTVVDIGRVSHQNIYDAPSQKGRFLGTLHGQSHGVMVLETNVDGYARIGTWRQEDGEYVEGYVPQHRLKNVFPNAHYGLLVDKTAQTMTVYRDGHALGSLSISTGLMAKNKLFRETPAGAFLTTDRSAFFNDSGYAYRYAIRIDGGNLIHSPGAKMRGSKWDFSDQLPLLGQKASHGCIRVDFRAGENGLNIFWLWTHLPFNTKVLVLDDPSARQARLAEINPTPTPSPVPSPSPTPSPVPTPTPVPTPSPTPSPTLVPTATPEPAFEKTLGFKSRGLAVVQLQERLQALDYYTGEIDGVFGRGTHAAVVAFQQANSLDADGLVGEMTFAALWDEAALAAPSAAPTQTPGPSLPGTDSPAPTQTPVPTPSPTPSPSPSPTPTPPPETTIVISLAGDALLGSEDKYRRREDSFDSTIAARGYDYPLQHFAPLFSEDDVTYINLECVLKNDSRNKLEGRMYNFRGPTDFTQILTAASVEHVNIANNHYIDYDTQGRTSTRRALDAAGVTYSGYTHTWIYEKDGVKIGFGGIRETIYKQNRSVPAREIAALRAAGCSYIFYQCHFGKEYDPHHNALQTEIAHALIDAGADCVVGTHPHVVQGIEVYNGKPIFYSLGNFVFGGNLTPTDYDGLAVQIFLHFDHGVCDGAEARLIPLMTSGVQDGTTDFCPVIAEGEDKARILRRIQEDSELEIRETLAF